MLTCLYLPLLIVGGGYIAISFLVGGLVDSRAGRLPLHSRHH
jgi:hypothetical protein